MHGYASFQWLFSFFTISGAFRSCQQTNELETTRGSLLVCVIATKAVYALGIYCDRKGFDEAYGIRVQSLLDSMIVFSTEKRLFTRFINVFLTVNAWGLRKKRKTLREFVWCALLIYSAPATDWNRRKMTTTAMATMSMAASTNTKLSRRCN